MTTFPYMHLSCRNAEISAHRRARTPATCKHSNRNPASFDLLSAVMSLVVKLMFSFYIVYRQKHLSVLAVIYPSLTYIVFPLYPVRTHSAAAGHPCHIFNASIYQPVIEIEAFFFIHPTHNWSNRGQWLWPEKRFGYWIGNREGEMTGS